MNDAEQVDEERDAIEDWQRPQTRFQRVLGLQNVAVNQHVETDAHSSTQNGGDEPRADDCALNKIKLSTKFFGGFSSLSLPNLLQFNPVVPRATKLKPIVDPTMLCVPEIGSLRNVATNSQSAELASADNKPIINSFS